ncbi:MAG: SDR family oxidoreductase [Defluviitaleaceae bacterium]|nr:SDR family oxidoreductase [Defluviitaleaceae bacterium]
MDYALITASTAGIGFAIAQKLLKQGCYCYINYAHNDERAEVASKKFSEISNNFCILKADLSDINGVKTIIEGVKNTPLKYVVLNCGITDKTPFGEITHKNWSKVFDSNVNMPFFLMQGLYDSMENESSIVLISSILGRHPHAMSVSYGVSKAAMSALCQNMVKILAPKKIRINALEPGFVDTDWQKEKPQAQRANIENKIALGRFAEPNEIADMCYNVLCNTYINGSIIPICGGYSMS